MSASFDNPNDDPRKRRSVLEDVTAAPVSAPTGAPGSVSPGGGLTEAAPGARHGTGYVNLQTFLGANRGAGQQMAQGVADETARQGNAERAALQSLQAGQAASPELEGRAQDTAARARLAAPGGGGLSTVLAQDYGQKGPYTSGMGAFDAFLAGGAGGKTLQQSGNAYGNLGGEVQAWNTQAGAYQPPSQAVAPPSAAAPSATGGPTHRPRAPAPSAPMSPLTYNPEQREGGAPAARRRNQQIDPNSWLGKPWGQG